MYLFDGKKFASQLEEQLKRDVTGLKKHKKLIPSIHSVVFEQDAGGLLYARLKSQASARVGIKYTQHKYSYADDKKTIIAHINQLNQSPDCTAILIQKPHRRSWVTVTGQAPAEFNIWWRELVTTINPAKDVDGLRPDWTSSDLSGNRGLIPVWPATAQAVWLILNQASQILHRPLTQEKIAIVGVSDLLGWPLRFLMARNQIDVTLLSHRDFDALVDRGVGLTDFSTLISATGQPGLITGQMLRPDSILIDVGEPRPDFDQDSVRSVASFLTPVPGGVGPVTVMCLLRNAVELVVVSSDET